MNYYNVLGVDRNASKSQISAQYRKLAMKCHPDRNPNKRNAVKRFKAVTEAFETLGNPKKRARYDLTLERDAEVVLAEVVETEQASSAWHGPRQASRRKRRESRLKDKVGNEDPAKTLGQGFSIWLDGYHADKWPLTHLLAFPLVALLIVGFLLCCWFSHVFLRDRYV
jgi:curved DNA-binding protein CbpA